MKKSKVITYIFLRTVPFCTKIKEPLSPQLNECIISETQAAGIAQSFQKREGINWGNLILGESKNGVYYFYYATPESEIPLLGYRGIWVNCKTTESDFLMRD